ncbi:transcriptional regulator [Lactococcus lactis]|uniref:transcriptional regulator n=1 Tax=Lactococcus lactis TaxID=1358 RepID=UPI003D0CB0C8
MENGKTPKPQKPIYKKVWFWLLVIVVVALGMHFTGGAKGGDGGDSSDSTKESQSTMTSKEKASSEAVEASKAKADADQAAKDKAAAKAKEEADAKNPATYPTLTYDEMARNGNKHKGEKLQITGKVIQVTDGDDGTATLRVATNGDYDDVYLAQIDSSEWENHRLLEGDQVTLYGKVYGLYTYESTMGGNITVPALAVVFY